MSKGRGTAQEERDEPAEELNEVASQLRIILRERLISFLRFS